MKKLLAGLLVLAAAVAGLGWWWLDQPLRLGDETVEFTLEPGTPARNAAQLITAAGVDTRPELLHLWFRLSGKSQRIKAGSYAIGQGVTPRTLLDKLVRGEVIMLSITFPEGITVRQMRALLEQAPHLRGDSRPLSNEALMTQLGKPGTAAEGRFFPDTYAYAKGSSDLAVLQQAMRAMDQKLEAAWAMRRPDTPLKSADEMLTLASIVEKETGLEADRALIAAVFENRLRIGMLLQTDPTVIYGMGEKFDGNLRKADLQRDTPWNTYTRAGLPPTPICLPGQAALMAVAQPQPTRALYFVARGDGSSHFSESLNEHNRAVNRWQRGR